MKKKKLWREVGRNGKAVRVYHQKAAVHSGVRIVIFHIHS